MTDLSTVLTIAVAIFTLIGSIYGGLKVMSAYRKNQREAHIERVQKRIEYLKEQMRTLQKVNAEFEHWTAASATVGNHVQYANVIGQARAVLLSVGNIELDTIATRLNPVRQETTREIENNRNAISDGLKCLARIIAEESTK